MGILYLFEIVFFTISLASAFQAYYKVHMELSGLLFSHNVLLHNDNVTGFHNCVKLCKKHLCMSFSACEADRLCRLYSSVFTNTSGAISHPGARYFERWADSCFRWKTTGHPQSTTGTYKVWFVHSVKWWPFLVLCDMITDGGGWTVVQNRFDGSVTFPNTEWNHYQHTFGSFLGEFWLGLATQKLLCVSKPCELRIELEDWNGVWKYAKYSAVRVMWWGQKYELMIYGFTGTAGDSMGNLNGMQFSTIDTDLDNSDDTNCADRKQSGWWFNNCSLSNLNGRYAEDNGTEDETAMTWWTFHNSYRPLKKSKMMVRVIDNN